MLQELKKSVASSTKIDFWALEMSLHWGYSWWSFPRRISIGPNDSDLLVCLIPSTYVGMHSSALGPAALLWGADVAVCHLSVCQGLTQKSSFWYTSSGWPYAGRAKSTYVQYNLSGSSHLSPQMKNQHSSWEKKLIGKTQSLSWVQMMWPVQLVWILTTKRKSLVRVENFWVIYKLLLLFLVIYIDQKVLRPGY